MISLDLITILGQDYMDAFFRRPALNVFAKAESVECSVDWLVGHWKAPGRLFVLGRSDAAEYRFDGKRLTFVAKHPGNVKSASSLWITSDDEGIYSVTFQGNPKLLVWNAVSDEFRSCRAALDSLSKTLP